MSETSGPNRRPTVVTPRTFRVGIGAIPPRVIITEPLLARGSDELLLQAIVEAGDRTQEGTLIQAVALPWFEIVEQIKREPEFLYQFARHSRKFEEFIAACYKKAGYADVVLTPPSGDLGIDVIVAATLPGVGSVRFVDQVKAYSPGTLVSAADVRALYGVLASRQDACKGIVTTTSRFAPGVANEFGPMIPARLELKDHDKLIDWLRKLSSRPDAGPLGQDAPS